MKARSHLRRVLALWAAALWILGFEVAPNVHLGLHGVIAAHRHGAPADDRDHARADDHGHAHDHGHDHHDDADHDRGDEATDEHGADDARGRVVAKRADLGHGAHALLHRGIAIAVPPVAMPDIAGAQLFDADLFVESNDILVERADVQSRARGPPDADEPLVVASV